MTQVPGPLNAEGAKMSLRQKSLVIAGVARQSISLDCRAALAMTAMAEQFFGKAWPAGGLGMLHSYE